VAAYDEHARHEVGRVRPADQRRRPA
jgi:hypothetical protein